MSSASMEALGVAIGVFRAAACFLEFASDPGGGGGVGWSWRLRFCWGWSWRRSLSSSSSSTLISSPPHCPVPQNQIVLHGGFNVLTHRQQEGVPRCTIVKPRYVRLLKWIPNPVVIFQVMAPYLNSSFRGPSIGPRGIKHPTSPNTRHLANRFVRFQPNVRFNIAV